MFYIYLFLFLIHLFQNLTCDILWLQSGKPGITFMLICFPQPILLWHCLFIAIPWCYVSQISKTYISHSNFYWFDILPIKYSRNIFHSPLYTTFLKDATKEWYFIVHLYIHCDLKELLLHASYSVSSYATIRFYKLFSLKFCFKFHLLNPYKAGQSGIKKQWILKRVNDNSNYHL